MRAIADAVRYAHGKKIVHRAFSPESILVTNPDSGQAGYRGTIQGGGDLDVSPTSHLEDMVEGPAAPTLLPRSSRCRRRRTNPLDLFDLNSGA
jgi:serine/threonine protein kinase